YSQLTRWDDRFAGTAPYRVPYLVYAPFPFDAEVRHWHGQLVVDVSETFEQKLAAIECYRSQFDAERFARVRHFVTGQMIAVGGRGGGASPGGSCSPCRSGRGPTTGSPGGRGPGRPGGRGCRCGASRRRLWGWGRRG